VVQLHVAVPPGWLVLDLDRATQDATHAAVLDERARTNPTIAPRRAELLELLRDMARAQAAAGVTFSAYLTDDRHGGLVGANIAVAFQEAGGPFDAEALAGVLAESADGEPTDVDRLDLTVGPAVRLHGRRTTTLSDQTLQVALVQVWFPGPVDRTVGVLTATAPALELADELTAVATEVAQTIRYDGGAGS
jgi:hypothetical protein